MKEEGWVARSGTQNFNFVWHQYREHLSLEPLFRPCN